MDRQLEREALRVAFAGQNVRAVREFERPDFIVLIDEHLQVGVEVTEVWASESEARLERIPGYIRDLVNGGKARNNLDARNIRVVRDAEFENLAGDRETLPEGVVTQQPGWDAHLSLLADAIMTKNAKQSGYAWPLNGNDLVIIDRVLWMKTGPGPAPTTVMLNERLRTAIRESPYHDILVLAVADDRAQHLISLRSVYIAERLKIAVEIAKPLDLKTRKEYMSVLALIAFSQHSRRLAFGYTLMPERVHLGHFTIDVEQDRLDVRSNYSETKGFLKPEWPAAIDGPMRTALVRKSLACAPPERVSVDVFHDVSDLVTGSLLLRRFPESGGD